MTADHGTAHLGGAEDAAAHDAAHGPSHGADHDQERSEPLGPIDLIAWGYAVAGGLIGLITALALSAATHL